MSQSALWALAFRPFFLLAGIFGAALIAAWVAVYRGALPPPRYFSVPSVWHAHEMLFGFTAAAVVGFLMTASQNWTGVRGVHGWRLRILAGVWVAARFLPWLVGERSVLYAVVDGAFLPLAAIFLAPYLARSSQRRNAGFLGMLALLAAANALVHLETWVPAAATARRGLLLGLDAVLVIITVIGGRVVPMFTRNAAPGARVRGSRALDLAAIGSTAAYMVADLVAESAPLTGTLALVAGATNAARMALWDPWATRANPMLWVLFSGYAWLVVGLVLRGFGALVPINPGLALHAFGVGAIGVLIYGMMPRVSLGHTGRKIAASPVLIGGFLLVNAAAFTRVVVAGLFPARYVDAVTTAGSLWAVAFALFAGAFWRVLTSPRADGRPG